MRVAIIGHGILGAVAAAQLDSSKIEVHIFDLVGDQADQKYFHEPDGPKSLRHVMSHPKGSPGNLEFWGRAVTSYIVNTEIWPDRFISNLPRYGRILKKYGFPQLKPQEHNYETGYLKIAFAKTAKYRKRVEKQGFGSGFVRHNALVTALIPVGESVRLQSTDEQGEIREHSFDQVILCAGSLNSFNLISRSRLIPAVDCIDYQDHPTIWLGEIVTTRWVLLKNSFQNKVVTYGSKAGAVVTRLSDDCLITVRVRPLIENTPDDASILFSKSVSVSFLKRALSKMGLTFCNRFSVAVSFDFSGGRMQAIISDSGEVSQFTYSSSGPRVDGELFDKVEQLIGDEFGAFKATWTREHQTFVETAAAHYSSFLGNLKNAHNDSVMDGFRMREYSRISIPGSVSFPSAVVGHPTYLALKSVLFEVERINNDSASI
jgi:hypothetical protein